MEEKLYFFGRCLSRRSVTKPEAASEARREIARNAPPSVVFYEIAVVFYKKKYLQDLTFLQNGAIL